MLSLKVGFVIALAGCFISIVRCGSSTNTNANDAGSSRTARQGGYWPLPLVGGQYYRPFWSQYYGALPVYHNILSDVRNDLGLNYQDYESHQRVKSGLAGTAAEREDALMLRQRPVPRIQWTSADGSPCTPNLFQPFLNWLGLTTTTTTTTTRAPATAASTAATTCAPTPTCAAPPPTAEYTACTRAAVNAGLFSITGTNPPVRAVSNAVKGVMRGDANAKSCQFIVIVSPPYNQIRVTCEGVNAKGDTALGLFGGTGGGCNAAGTLCAVGAAGGLAFTDTYISTKSTTSAVMFAMGTDGMVQGSCSWEMVVA